MNRTVYIGNPAYLKCHHQQLKVVDPQTGSERGSVPIEDIAFVVLDHPQITMTHYLMQQLIVARAAIISCDDKHLPHSIQLPFAGHTEHTERVIAQTNMSAPLKKQLWKQTVEAKISNQARLLHYLEREDEPMWIMMQEVRSGDSTNREGVAAKYYWQQMFTHFTRERYGDPPNHLLNYGYAILRSVVARALSSAGFHLALGIHHRSKYNATCLADDLMEPYRPYVDQLVYEMASSEDDCTDELTRESKVELLTIPQLDVQIDGKRRPLQIAATITAASLHRCLSGHLRHIRYPIM